MQKHHRGSSPTSRPDCSFTVKPLCCAAHLEKAAWSRGHRAQRQAAPAMDKASKDQLPHTYASSLPRLLSDFCLHWEMLAISPCFCCGAESSQRRVTFLFPSTVTYSSFCFIHCSPPEHFPSRAIILNVPPRAQVFHNERMVRRGGRDACPEHSVWIHFWDATAGHWKLDRKGDSVKGKVNDCNVKSAAHS